MKRQTARTGDKSFDTAAARGILAIGYARAARDADAVREFKASIPIMLAAARENADDDDATVVAARSARLQRIVEAYISVLLRSPNMSNDVAIETFALADAVRGHAVQKALANSSARAVAKDPALAQLVRTEQDLAKQISAQLGALNNLLALPSAQRDDGSVSAITAAIEKLRADRKTARLEINRRFPSYAGLVDPKPPTVDEIKAALRPGEALLSFYFGQDASFVWAVPKDGAVALAAVPATAIDLEAKVRRLRQALEPQITMVSEIPPFDVALAYELYGMLLKPVEAAWRPAKSLIVVTNGALGELPLDLLPTAPAQVDMQAKPLFAGYRNVPWLARTPCGHRHSFGFGAGHLAPPAARFAPARQADRIRRPLFQRNGSGRSGSSGAGRHDAGGCGRGRARRRRGDTRPSAQAACLSSHRRCRHRRAGDAAEATGYPASN